jgi:hypothetical protein
MTVGTQHTSSCRLTGSSICPSAVGAMRLRNHKSNYHVGRDTRHERPTFILGPFNSVKFHFRPIPGTAFNSLTAQKVGWSLPLVDGTTRISLQSTRQREKWDHAYVQLDSAGSGDQRNTNIMTNGLPSSKVCHENQPRLLRLRAVNAANRVHSWHFLWWRWCPWGSRWLVCRRLDKEVS